ncbi:cystathionine gamma-synthase [Photobacterium damselae subsp. piscicida]|nr:cystathionine gamma-synthase [Photobacterium damselae subsp. piscicida]
MASMSNKRSATIAVRSGIDCDSQYNAVVPPIYLTSTYSFNALGEVPQYDYSRSGNPTRNTLAEALAQLEQGAGAVVTNCGTAAINLLVSALLGPNDLVVAPHDCYGGTYRLLNTRAQKGDFQVRFINQGDPQALTEALSLKPKLIWVETPRIRYFAWLILLIFANRLRRLGHKLRLIIHFSLQYYSYH